MIVRVCPVLLADQGDEEGATYYADIRSGELSYLSPLGDGDDTEIARGLDAGAVMAASAPLPSLVLQW